MGAGVGDHYRPRWMAVTDPEAGASWEVAGVVNVVVDG